ncbi:GtrA family protein [Pusillimonas sp. SM2304]|uniref:GtrA family protein n=1 Tax=Pusillimonas sp. SM2304 TaxID=3073241 RepID=UPI002876F206|nr:GtrA family protein [Pusillimonas sp. SM2304]MDS1140867.1 GtrA family protein [Pusillimonas sp. SM2304]
MPTLISVSPARQARTRHRRRRPAASAASLAAQVMPFLASGGLATLVHWAWMGMLVWAGLAPVLATTAGALAGAIVNYLLQFYWTFKGNSRHGRAVPAYIRTVILGCCANAALFYFLNSIAHAGPTMAQLCATLAVAAMNFILYKKVVFHERISRKLAP